MSNKKFIIGAILTLISPFLLAENLTTQPTIDELTRINEEIALLSAKKREIELKAEIAARGGSETVTGGSGTTSFIISGTADTSLPLVKAIEGINGQLNATISFAAGTEQIVKTGDKIRGKWTVKKITFNSVTLSRGNEEAQLAFGQEPAKTAHSGTYTGGGYQSPISPPASAATPQTHVVGSRR